MSGAKTWFRRTRTRVAEACILEAVGRRWDDLVPVLSARQIKIIFARFMAHWVHPRPEAAIRKLPAETMNVLLWRWIFHGTFPFRAETAAAYLELPIDQAYKLEVARRAMDTFLETGDPRILLHIRERVFRMIASADPPKARAMLWEMGHPDLPFSVDQVFSVARLADSCPHDRHRRDLIMGMVHALPPNVPKQIVGRVFEVVAAAETTDQPPPANVGSGGGKGLVTKSLSRLEHLTPEQAGMLVEIGVDRQGMEEARRSVLAYHPSFEGEPGFLIGLVLTQADELALPALRKIGVEQALPFPADGSPRRCKVHRTILGYIESGIVSAREIGPCGAAALLTSTDPGVPKAFFPYIPEVNGNPRAGSFVATRPLGGGLSQYRPGSRG